MGATVRAARTAGGAGALLVAAAVAMSGLPGTSTLPSAAQDAEGDLVDRFLDLVEEVPPIDPENILVADLTRERELLGDFIADHAQLEAVHDEALQLFIDADEAGGLDGEAISDGARAVILIEEGYARWADLELVVPFSDFDELGVATGTDPARSLAEQGIDLVMEGHVRLAEAFVILNAQDLPDAQRSRLDDAIDAGRFFESRVEPALRDYARDFTSQQILTVDRFEGTTGTARARSATYLCIPRGAGDALSPEALAEALAFSLAFVADDCPNFPDPELLTAEEAAANLVERPEASGQPAPADDGE